MVYAPAPTATSPKGVIVRVSVVGRNGKPLGGCRITFLVGNEIVGTIDPSNGSGSILLPGGHETLIVEASYGSSVVQHVVYQEHNIVVQLDEDEPLFKAFTRGLAVCPDGTSGQPCVTCSLGGKPYQICA